MERSRRTPRGEYFEGDAAESERPVPPTRSVFVAGTLAHDASTPAEFFDVSVSVLVQFAAVTSASLTECSKTSTRTVLSEDHSAVIAGALTTAGFRDDGPTCAL